MGFPLGSVVKNPPANAGDMGSIPGSGRSPEVGNGNPLQYSCLENSKDRGAWWAIVHKVAERHNWACSCTQTHRHTHTHKHTQKSYSTESLISKN